MLISIFPVIFCGRLPNRMSLDWQNISGDMKSCFCFNGGWYSVKDTNSEEIRLMLLLTEIDSAMHSKV